MVINKILYKYPVTVKATTNTKSIFGTNISGVRGKPLIFKPNITDTEEYVGIPMD